MRPSQNTVITAAGPGAEFPGYKTGYWPLHLAMKIGIVSSLTDPVAVR